MLFDQPNLQKTTNDVAGRQNMSPIALAELISSNKYHFSNEIGLQDGIMRVLGGSGIEVDREFDLGDSGRIDFYIPSERIGIECKVHDSPSSVLSQMQRYAKHPKIDRLILVSAKRGSASLVPDQLAGVPILKIVLWQNNF